MIEIIMTTGSYDDQSTWITVGTSIGTGKSGFRRQKTWSGTDYPHIVVRPTYVYSPNPYGSKKYIRQRLPKSPPKRASTEEHSYSTNVTTTRDLVFTFEDPLDGLGSRTCTMANSGFYAGFFTQDWDTNADLALLGKLREKVGGSDFNLGVFLAEANQSLKMIGDGATRIARVLRNVQHGNFVAAGRSLFGPVAGRRFKNPNRFGDKRQYAEDASRQWLEIVYGIKPLLSDVQSGAEFLGKVLNFPMCQTYTVQKTVRGRFTPQDPCRSAPSAVCNTSVRIKAKVSEVNVPQLIGLTDVASVAWEKLPFSFVADWFVPIGSYLSARGLASALSGTFVTSRTVRSVRTGTIGVNPLRIILSEFHKLHRQETVAMTRVISNSLAVPMPSSKGLAKAASWQHCANAVALVTQMASGSKGWKSYGP